MSAIFSAMALDNMQQAIDIDRFGKMPGHRDLRHSTVEIGPRRYDHHRNRRQSWVLLLRRTKLPAVHIRHHEIQEDQAWWLRLSAKLRERIEPISCGGDSVPLVFKDFRE